MIIYFAHPVNTYDTPVEKAVLTLVAHCFPTAEIANPNTPDQQKAYDAKVSATGGVHADHKGMEVFYQKVEECDSCVAMPFLDRRLGLGVAGETQKALKLGKHAWLVEPSHELSAEELDAFAANPLNGSFRIRQFTQEEICTLRDHPGDLKNDPPANVVPHEETRLRTFVVYNKERRPYAESHTVRMPVPEGFYPDKK